MDAVVQRDADPHAAAWADFVANRSAAARSTLIAHYLPLARTVASRLYRTHARQGVQFADYLQYARVGLIESVDRFDPGRGVRFALFAFSRIRGAVLNGLARETELVAQRFALRRIMQERVESLAGSMAERPAQATLEDFAGLTVGLAMGALIALDPQAADESTQANPYCSTELGQLARLARDAVEQLPQRERELIKAHYYEHREFQELAERWSLTKGRISQLHARAIQMLQALVVQSRLDRQL